MPGLKPSLKTREAYTPFREAYDATVPLAGELIEGLTRQQVTAAFEAHRGSLSQRVKLKPLAKAARELRRLGRVEPVVALARDSVGAVRHSLAWRRARGRATGLLRLSDEQQSHLAAASRVIVLVLYGPLDSKRSLIELLRKGLGDDEALLIVHNQSPGMASLEGFEEQLAALPNCIYQPRPNIGYDFGAYRDGICAALHHCADLQEIVMVNDSFTVLSEEGFKRDLAWMREEAKGLRALMDNSHVPFEVHAHLGSFLVRYGADVVQSAAFKDYWRAFPYYFHKDDVIFYGEKGVYRALDLAWGDLKSLYGARHLDLDALSQAQLHQFVEDMVITNEVRDFYVTHTAFQKTLLSLDFEDAKVRDAAITWIKSLLEVAVTSRMFSIAYSRLFGLPILKNDLLKLDSSLLERAKEALSDFESRT